MKLHWDSGTLYQQLPPPEDEEEEPKRPYFEISKAVLAALVVLLAIVVVVESVSIHWILLENHHFVQPPSKCPHTALRMEWRTLSRTEQLSYIEAIQCVRKAPSRLGQNQSLWEDFSWFHARSESAGHKSKNFFSWHRQFLRIFEDVLQSECGFQGSLPYWDWTLDWNNFEASPIFDETYGFGGNGTEGTTGGFRGSCVTTGPFANMTVSWVGNIFVEHCLSRGFRSGEDLAELVDVWKPANIKAVLDAVDLDEFKERFEQGLHIALTHAIHGDFSVGTNPIDPIWWLHHTQIDHLWWMWQVKDPEYRLHTIHQPVGSEIDMNAILEFGELGDSVRVQDVIDTQGGELCYRF